MLAVSVLAVAGGLGAACRGDSQPIVDRQEAKTPAVAPNVLWIIAEDFGPDLGVYGDVYANTPRLDRLATEGVRFTRAFATSPAGSAARSTIVTGMYATSIGTHHHRSLAVPPPQVKAFPEWLRAAGYFTTNNERTDYNVSPQLDQDPSRAVFDAPVGAWDESGPTAHWRDRAEGQPFFSVFNLDVTHESQLRLSDEDFAGRTQGLGSAHRHDPADADLPPHYPETPTVRRDWARYYDLVTVLDRRVGEIIDELEAAGLADTTVVMFTSDHGRGFPRDTRRLYDSGLRVPLVARWPGVLEPGSVRDDLVSFLDLAPTVLAVTGVEGASHLQGRVFLGSDSGPEPAQLFLARDRIGETRDRIRAVRSPRYKYIRNFASELPATQPLRDRNALLTMQEWRRLAATDELTAEQQHLLATTKPSEELYDTEADPHEVTNLAADANHRDRLASMREVLDRWIVESGDLGEMSEAELVAMFRPDGVIQTAAPPRISPAGGTFHGPPTVSITCPTEGASAVYTTALKGAPRWSLYSGPFRMGDWRLRAKCGRLGYVESDIVDFPFDVEFHWIVPETPAPRSR